jgi:hypothetical protein
VALSGTLDSFALPDVLRLLASSMKTGRLRVTGDRGGGSVWIDDGAIASTELTGVDSIDSTHADVLFSLIRFDTGSFTFEVDARMVNTSETDQLEPILVAAEQMLIEWRAIEEVVPSLDAIVTLSPEPRGGDVMIDAPRWRCIAAVASGATADSVGATLGQSELEVCRTIKELVELGLMDISEAPPTPEVVAPVEQTAPILEDLVAEDAVQRADGADEPDTDLAGIDGVSLQADEVDDALADVGDVGVVSEPVDSEPVDSEPVDSEPVDSEPVDSEPVDSEPSHVGGDSPRTPSILDSQPLDGVGQGEPDQFVTTAPGLAGLIPETDPDAPSRSMVEPLAEFAPGLDETVGANADGFGADTNQDANRDLTGDFFGGATADEEAASDDLDPAEMARQLANLSPKAAKAVAAAAKASTDAERDEALAAVEAEDDTVNRGLLLKFLGSVDG